MDYPLWYPVLVSVGGMVIGAGLTFLGAMHLQREERKARDWQTLRATAMVCLHDLKRYVPRKHQSLWNIELGINPPPTDMSYVDRAEIGMFNELLHQLALLAMQADAQDKTGLGDCLRQCWKILDDTVKQGHNAIDQWKKDAESNIEKCQKKFGFNTNKG